MTLGEFRKLTHHLPDDAVLIHKGDVFPYYAIQGICVGESIHITGSAYRDLGLLEIVYPNPKERPTVEVICG